MKIYYTSKLVHHGLKREALAYCEEIGHTLIKQGNAAYVQLVDLQLFILVCGDFSMKLSLIVFDVRF